MMIQLTQLMVISLCFISWSLAQPLAHGALAGSLAGSGDATACSSEKIFARAVAEECGGEGPTLDWTAFTGEVFDARSSLFIHGGSVAEERLQHLLALVGQSYSLVSQCPAAVATTSYSLAEVRAARSESREMWLRQLALLQLSLAVYPLAAHEECTQWPLRGRDLVAAFSRLGHKVFPQHSVPKDDPTLLGSSVALVSVCAGWQTELMRSSAREQFQIYAERHGYDLYFFADAQEVLKAFHFHNLTSLNSPAFWRAYALQLVLDLGRHDWLMWLECDLILTDPARDVSSILSSNGAAEAQLLITADGWGIQPDIMLLKGGAWSRGFLENWTRLPSIDFLHGSTRLPPETRDPERIALQHNSLPHWSAWLQAATPLWSSFTWTSEISLAMALVTTVDPGKALPEVASFAVRDAWCRGRRLALQSRDCDARRQRLASRKNGRLEVG